MEKLLAEFLAPVKRLLDNRHLIERVADLEHYYTSFCKKHADDSAITELLAQYAQLFHGIDAKPLVEKEKILEVIYNFSSQFPHSRTEKSTVHGSQQQPDSQTSSQPAPIHASHFTFHGSIERMESFLSRPLSQYKGIGPKLAELLEKKGLMTVRDALFFLPYQYIDKRRVSTVRELQDGHTGYFKAKIADVRPWSAKGFLRRMAGGLMVTVSDGTGIATLRWFYPPPPFLKELLKKDNEVIIFGKVQIFRGQKEMHHPEIRSAQDFDVKDELEGIKLLPVYYGLPAGISDRLYRRIVHEMVQEGRGILKCLVPERLKERLKLVDWSEALVFAHFPGDAYNEKMWLEHRSICHLSLIYQELFLFFALFMQRKSGVKKMRVEPVVVEGRLAAGILKTLKFELTGAQKRVLHEIQEDLSQPYPMQRLLQGDVGSGKTIVALLSALHVIEAGKQVAIMAPTEILAEQHYITFRNLLAGLDIKVGLVVSGMKKKEKDAMLEGIASGECQLVVGTHALIQETVRFKDLSLAIVDEQHRFGVDQRGMLIQKGRMPHVLLMTATPIPRTLSMTLYGDLNVSVIDELPPHRKAIKTSVYPELQRDRAFAAMKAELNKGRQAYVVYPVIDEDNALELKAATKMYELIKDKFSEYTVGLLHGRFSSDDKETVMKAFKGGQTAILVSTTVIEVGIDVPNATVMVIEHGERFGLSQLHQLRGRIGRGADESFCIVLVDTKKLGQKARERLIFFRDTLDGFKLAEFDLTMRGPGEILGTRQSGIPELSVTDLLRDAPLIEMMKKVTEDYFASSSRDAEYAGMLDSVLKLYFSRKLEYAYVG